MATSFSVAVSAGLKMVAVPPIVTPATHRAGPYIGSNSLQDLILTDDPSQMNSPTTTTTDDKLSDADESTSTTTTTTDTDPQYVQNEDNDGKLSDADKTTSATTTTT